MKVKHSWLLTATMRCDLVITIKCWRNAPEHNDLSALRRPWVFLKRTWLQTIPYFINKSKRILPCFILWESKIDFSAQLCLLRSFYLPRSLHTSPLCFRRVAVLLVNSQLNVRDVTRCSSSRKISTWHILNTWSLMSFTVMTLASLGPLAIPSEVLSAVACLDESRLEWPVLFASMLG